MIAGVIGARVYHLFTGYKWSEGGVVGTVRDLEGRPLDLGRGRAAASSRSSSLARRRHLDALVLMDAIAPGVVLAQAIGRWGNYFNQELFGRPTTLPWGLEIDLAHRPPGFTQYATFHPTFLYESLWCLLVFGTLLFVERRFPLKRGQVFALYVAMYTFGRIWFEALRIDDATRIFGIRFNLLLVDRAVHLRHRAGSSGSGRRPQTAAADAHDVVEPVDRDPTTSRRLTRLGEIPDTTRRLAP